MKKNLRTNSMKNLKLLTPFLKPYRLWMFTNALSALLCAVLTVMMSVAVRNLTDLAVNRRMEEFSAFIYFTLLIIVFSGIFTYFKNYSCDRFSMLAIRDISNSVVNHMQLLPVSYMEKHHSGDIVSRLNNDVSELSNLLKNISDLLYQPFVFIGAFIYMLMISPKLLFSTIVLIPISALVFDKIAKPTQKKSQELMEEMGEINTIAQDTINGAYVLKSFNLKDILYSKYESGVFKVFKKSMEIQKLNSLLRPIFLVLRFIPQLVCPLYGGYLAMKGEISIGGLLASNTIIWSLFIPVESLLSLLQKIRTGIPAIERLYEILEHPVERYGGVKPAAINEEVPVKLEKVSFTYDGENNILEGINFELKHGKITALVGPSGSGKSTILRLICGFYLPTDGRVMLYGNDLMQSDITAIRSRISLVSQETYIFPGTVVENIGYGNPEASLNEIIEAAKASNAHEFIMKLPDGYNARIGQEGNKLSGGQRQRISLARAILKNTDILLLDEPTSALDTESESLVQEALKKFMSKKTVLVVAHRLSTIKESDEVLVINNGAVAESGTHDSLMEIDSLYRKLYQKQLISINNEVAKEGA